MNYKKFIALFYLSCSYSIIQAEEPSWFYKLLVSLFSSTPEITNNNQQTINYSNVRQEIRAKFDYLFATHDQDNSTRKDLLSTRERISNTIIEQLQQQYLNSERDALYKARELLHVAAIQYAQDKTEQYTHINIVRIRKNPPINPMYLKPVNSSDLITTLKQDIYSELSAININHYGVFKEYIGKSLEKKIAFKVEQAFGIHEQQAQSLNYPDYSLFTPQPSAPPLEEPLYPTVNQQDDGIIEIYLQVDGNRNKEYFNKITSGKIFREAECPVCGDDFKTLTKRVTLFCGHAFCPRCLYQWLYTAHKTTCPVCRDHIRTNEIPQHYLEQYIR